MSKQTNPVKKVIKTEAKKPEVFSGPSTPIGTRRKTTTSLTNTPVEFTFNRDNIRWLLISVGLVILGYALMMGGRMPSNEVWDEKLIYSFRRTVISPIVIITGLVLAIYAIFRHKPDASKAEES